MTPLLTLPAVAERLHVSVRLVQKMIRASELSDRPLEDMPPDLVKYVSAHFPKPVKIGKTVRRIRAEDLERWISQH